MGRTDPAANNGGPLSLLGAAFEHVDQIPPEQAPGKSSTDGAKYLVVVETEGAASRRADEGEDPTKNTNCLEIKSHDHSCRRQDAPTASAIIATRTRRAV
jgi:hypothetical protein